MWPCRRCLLSLSCALLLGASSSLSAQAFQVLYEDGLLSLRANNAPFNELVAALANETGIRFSTTGDSAPPVTLDIEAEPLAKAIAKLTPNHMLVRRTAAPDSEILEVVLMLDDSSSGSDSGGNEFLPTGAPSDEIIVSDPSQDGGQAYPQDNPPIDPGMSEPPPSDQPPEQMQDDGSGVPSG